MKVRGLLRTTIQKEPTKFLIYLLTNLARHGFDESENETTTIKMSVPLTHIDEFRVIISFSYFYLDTFY